MMWLMKAWKLRKTVALLLLLVAAADLAWPGICRTDGVVYVASSAVVVLSAASGSGGQTGSYYEDDCYCCCAHIIPALHSELAVALVDQHQSLSFAESEPQVYVPIPYPPPRS